MTPKLTPEDDITEIHMQPRKRKILKHGNERWEVDFGIDSTGLKKRKVLASEAEADDEIDAYGKAVKSRGEWWARLTELERESVQTVCKQIKAAGFSLARVWEDHQRWRKENAQTTIDTKPFKEAVDAWKDRKLAAGKSEDYVDEAAALLMRFGEGRERQNIHEISAFDLQTWLNAQMKPAHGGPLTGTWGLSSKKTNTSLFSSLWEVAVAMGWASINIVDRLEPIQRPAPTVKIHSNESILNLLAALMDNTASQKALLPVVLGAFGCMRPEEISQAPEDPKAQAFNWKDIDIKSARITVRPECAKTGDQRVIRLQPTAVVWLKFCEKVKCPLPPVNERRLIDAACELAKFEWIRDGLRKNCATHLRAVYKNDYDVVKDCGNSVRILLKHYADLHVPDSVSLKYWEITPKAVEAYRRTDKWKKVVRGANSTHAAPSTPSANETAKPLH